MYPKSKLFYFTIFSIIILLVIIVIAFIIEIRKPIRLLGSTPANNSQNVSTKEDIILRFSKKPNEEIIGGLTISPKNNLNPTIDGNDIIFNLNSSNYLLPATKYTITIKELNQRIIFKTEALSYDQLPLNTKKEIDEKENLAEEGKILGHEIMAYMPYEEDSFYIMHEENDDGIFYEIYTKIDDKEKAKKEALIWIKSKGADPLKLNLKYKEFRIPIPVKKLDINTSNNNGE